MIKNKFILNYLLGLSIVFCSSAIINSANSSGNRLEQDAEIKKNIGQVIPPPIDRPQQVNKPKASGQKSAAEQQAERQAQDAKNRK